MVRRRLLLLLKPLDAYPPCQTAGASCFTNPKISQVLSYLEHRRSAHKDTINFCQNILRKKHINWETISRSNLSESIRDVDLVVTVGGDGTLLRASHFLDNSIPLLGVNSDPTKAEEVEKLNEEFDATRSTGHLCAATSKNFEQILDDILENRIIPSEVARMSISINSHQLSTSALNDVLISHPCPAAVSRFSFRTCKQEDHRSSLVHSRSSGLRVSTAAGSTAAMQSAGGIVMPILSKDLQYMVREPISPGANSELMRGFIRFDESMEIKYYSKEGLIYVDGSHVVFSVQFGDEVELSSTASSLKLFLPSQLS